MVNRPIDSCPLDVLIAQTQRDLLQTIAQAIEPLGWRCNYVELFIEDGRPVATATITIQPTDPDDVDQDTALLQRIVDKW